MKRLRVCIVMDSVFQGVAVSYDVLCNLSDADQGGDVRGALTESLD